MLFSCGFSPPLDKTSEGRGSQCGGGAGTWLRHTQKASAQSPTTAPRCAGWTRGPHLAPLEARSTASASSGQEPWLRGPHGCKNRQAGERWPGASAPGPESRLRSSVENWAPPDCISRCTDPNPLAGPEPVASASRPHAHPWTRS